MHSAEHLEESTRVLRQAVVKAAPLRDAGRCRYAPQVGLVLLYMGSHVSALLGESDTTAPQVVPLTAIFFFVYFLLASQVTAHRRLFVKSGASRVPKGHAITPTLAALLVATHLGQAPCATCSQWLP